MAGGSVTRIKDTIIVQIKTNFKNLYFIKLDKEKSPETFASEVKIKFVSTTMEGKYCPTLISTSVHDFEVVALPSKAGTDEIFKKNHKGETVGIFSYLSVTDSKGKTMNFSEGDYVLVGGNSLKQEP
jgi:hypothetical protein